MKPNADLEEHPLKPFLPKGARVLMMGTFPPPRKRWSMDFYYPNPQNDMWRIFGIVFFADKNRFLNPGGRSFDKARLEKFLREKRVALSDSARLARRLHTDASDKFLEIAKPADVVGLLKKLPDCAAILATGQKAAETIALQVGVRAPKVGEFSEFGALGRKTRLYRMPSSSRAYPLSLEKKAAAYAEVFKALGVQP